VSGRQIEQLVDELILFTNINAADPPRLPFSDHVHRFVSLNRSPGCLELTKVLLGLVVGWLSDPAPGYCSNIGPVDVDSGGAEFLPLLHLRIAEFARAVI
jgi:hypothetical protein